MTTTPVADHGVLVVFDDQIIDETHARIHALDAALSRNPPAVLAEIVPAMIRYQRLLQPPHSTWSPESSFEANRWFDASGSMRQSIRKDGQLDAQFGLMINPLL
jgi:hypothetical protein